MNNLTQYGYTTGQEEEMRRCAASYTYFCQNYVKIIHPVKGLIPFSLYQFQERVVSEYEKFQFNIIKKFRQAGLTTVSVIWALWRCLFKFDQRIMVLSKSDREAIGVGKIVENVLDNLPKWMCPNMKNNNDHEKEFSDTGSVLWFYTCAAARSKALTYLIIDEAAFIPNMDEHWKAMYPTLSTGGNCIVISTVNGIGNWYEETWHRAEDKKNQFHIINLDYKEHPDYCSAEWERKMRANLGEKGWLQEICGSFLGSGETYIDPKVLTDMEKLCIEPVEKLFPEWDTMPTDELSEEDLANDEYIKGAFWIWKDRQPGREYILCADASEGVGADNSAFHVIDVQSFEQVAEFYSNSVPVHKFAQVVAQAGMLYNEALVVMDHDTGPGLAVLNRLTHTLQYSNLFYQDTKARGEKAGLTLSRTSRPLVCETLQTSLLNKLIRIRSRRLIRELKTFIYNKQKQRPEALKGKTDDLVMSLAMGLHVTDIANRGLPVGADPMHSRISQALIGKSLEEVKHQLEDGLPEDFFATDDPIEFHDLMPRVMFKETFRREGEDLLREFGW
jgi:hypothetical protein